MVNSKQQWKAWLYLSPAIVLLLVFTVWPIFNTVRMSLLENFKSLEAAAGATFQFGFGNFLKVLEYKRFLQCLKNTVLLCVLTVPISTMLALLIAVALNSIRPLQRFLQTIFFLPYVTNSIAIGMVFAAMFNIVGSFYGTENELIITAGIINNVIEFFGGSPVNWINYGSTYAANITVMVVYIVWNALPFKILILLGGLQGINKQSTMQLRSTALPAAEFSPGSPCRCCPPCFLMLSSPASSAALRNTPASSVSSVRIWVLQMMQVA